jgi:hypothetical protein
MTFEDKKIIQNIYFKKNEIFLSDLDSTKDNIMSKCFIKLTNIDRAAFGTSIVMIMKDEKNNFQRVAIYGFN